VDDQDKPRPRALTLAGVGSPSGPPVVGAVARPPAPGASEVTTRMIFAPPSEAAADAGSGGDPGEDGGIDDQWPDEPPSAAPVQIATVPPARLVSTAAPAKESSGARGARHGARRIALAALALVAGVIGLRAYRSGAHTVAKPDPSAAVVAAAPATATESASEPASASAPAGPAPAGPAPAGPAPAESPLAEPSPAASSPTVSAFDAVAAKHALDATASAIARCRRGNVSGPGHAIVTFGNEGAVLRTAVSPPFLGTAAGMCVARALSQARVPAFVGKTPAVVVHPFVVPAQ
jgi:hypothetical protein